MFCFFVSTVGFFGGAECVVIILASKGVTQDFVGGIQFLRNAKSRTRVRI